MRRNSNARARRETVSRAHVVPTGPQRFSHGSLAAVPGSLHGVRMATVEITAENFEQTIDKGGIVLLDFWAAWCGPCRAFAPVFEKASESHADVVFGKIDTEAQQELAGGMQIQAIPTLMLFRDGILLFRESGALPPAALESLLTQAKALDMNMVREKIKNHVHGPGCNHDHGHDHGDHGHDHGDGHDHHHGHEHGPDCDHEH